MRGSEEFAEMPGQGDFEGAVDVDRDRILVERCQSGDPEAFNSLYLHYHQRLLRFCVKRLQERSEAEDVVQETFARAWRALPAFAGDRRFYPWLTVIAGNLCTDALRRRSRLSPLDETMMGASDVGSYDIEDAVLQDVDAKMVTTAFENLKPRHQRVLDLRERSGWSYQRIADEEGVGVSAVETLLWRARNALKREFSLLAGAEGKAGALVGLAMALPRNALRRLPAPFRHVLDATRHVAGSVTPAGASMAAAGAVVVGLGAFYLAPGTSAITTPTATAPVTSTVAPAGGGPGLAEATPQTTTATAPLSTSSPDRAGSGAVPGAVASSPTTAVPTGGSGAGVPGTPAGSTSQASPASGLSQPLAGVTGGVGGAVAGAGSGLGGTVSGLGNTAGGTVSGVGSTAGNALGGSSSGLGQATTGVTGAVGGTVAGAGSGLGQAVTGVTGGVNSLLGGPAG
ncbi:MAG TPA: sigma-70 family RNA polymerase sigma factor [Acidimicrobiales bacterium]|nr:sigma-70 family RNA polymerase sigma factor [Acidimicrobiales bacterium]